MTGGAPADVVATVCAECDRLAREIANAAAAKGRVEAKQARARFTVPLEKYSLQLEGIGIRLRRRQKDLVLHVAAAHGRVVVNTTPTP